MKLKNIKPALVLFVLLIIGSFSFFAAAQDKASGKQTVFNDSDRDGLSDDEEKIYRTDPNNPDSDGDGYSDGVEVASGYDPLKAAPGDKIIASMTSNGSAVLGDSMAVDASGSDNATSQVSAKLADFIKENEGKTGEMSVNNLDAIIQEAMGDKLNEEPLPEIDAGGIKIKKQNYGNFPEGERARREKEDALHYLTSVLYIAISNAPEKITSDEDMSGFTQQIIGQASTLLGGSSDGVAFFNDMAERGQLMINQMNDIEVPEKFLSTHKKGLQLAKRAMTLKSKIVVNPNDPMGLIVSLAKVQGLAEQGSSFLQDVLAELEKYGVSSATTTVSAAVVPAIASTSP